MFVWLSVSLSCRSGGSILSSACSSFCMPIPLSFLKVIIAIGMLFFSVRTGDWGGSPSIPYSEIRLFPLYGYVFVWGSILYWSLWLCSPVRQESGWKPDFFLFVILGLGFEHNILTQRFRCAWLLCSGQPRCFFREKNYRNAWKGRSFKRTIPFSRVLSFLLLLYRTKKTIAFLHSIS